jgi:hypothetical protein
MVRSGSRALGVDPLQSLHFLPAARCVGTGSGFLEVLGPFDDVTRASPMVRRTVRSRRGSALRFSQPLSGFLACPGFAALFRAAAARGVLPSERCSSPGSRAPLGVAVLPCSSPPNAKPRARTRPCHSGFHRRPRREARWPGSPPELEHRFHRACACARIGFPGTLDRARPPGLSGVRLRLLRSLDPPAKPYLVRHRSDGPGPLLPWASPLQSLTPIEPRGLMTQRTVPSTAR